MSFMHRAIAVEDRSQIGEARRCAVAIAEDAGFSETNRGRVALIATELATNLVKYAKNGQILLRPNLRAAVTTIEIVSIDRGPGIEHFERCLADGYSTGGTSGTGLGAVRRLCSAFDVFTSVPNGTVIFCEFDPNTTSQSAHRPYRWSTINLPAPNETVCGDTWRIVERDEQLALIVIDGLGHGPEAAVAANEAAAVFCLKPFSQLSEMFETLHARLRGTRGGAIAACQMNHQSRVMKFVGVGNIAGTIKTEISGDSRGLFSHNGTIGAQFHKIQQFEYPIPTNGLVILHSDGLQSRWSLDKYPGLAQRHPGVIAGVLFRDFCRGRDDVTVVVIRLAP